MPAKRDPLNLVWMDLEMTGLDPERHVIIEIATLITDSNLEVLAEGPTFAIQRPAEALALMDAWNVKTHTESGLVARIARHRDRAERIEEGDERPAAPELGLAEIAERPFDRHRQDERVEHRDVVGRHDDRAALGDVLEAPHLQAVDSLDGRPEQPAQGRVDQKLGRVAGNSGSVSFAARESTICMSRNERMAKPASQ